MKNSYRTTENLCQYHIDNGYRSHVFPFVILENESDFGYARNILSQPQVNSNCSVIRVLISSNYNGVTQILEPQVTLRVAFSQKANLFPPFEFPTEILSQQVQNRLGHASLASRDPIAAEPSSSSLMLLHVLMH